MALINSATREMTAKIVYHGPGLSGKTTNLKYLFENIDDAMRGEMLSLPAEGERTVLFDILPVEMGSYKGFKVRLQLYTVPGQVRREEARKTVLKGVDGIVFVADSQKEMAEPNIKAFDQMRWHLLDMGLFLEDIPLVLQYNKRDIKGVLSVEEMDKDLNPGSTPFFEAIANTGVGVEDTFKAIAALVLRKLVAQAGVAEARPAGAKHAEEKPVFAEEAADEAVLVGQGAGERRQDDNPLLAGDDSTNLLLMQASTAADSIFGEFAAAQPAAPRREAREEVLEEAAAPEAGDSVLQTEDPVSDEVSTDPGWRAPVLQLRPGQPLEAHVEIQGRRYKLLIELVPDD
jgi:mutual gliding-motility protein MglA